MKRDKSLTRAKTFRVRLNVVKARDLIKSHAKLSDENLLAAIAKLDAHEKDLLVSCKACGADEGEECKPIDRKKRACLVCFKQFHECTCAAGPYVKRGKNLVRAATQNAIKPGIVHIGRRIRRLLAGIR